MSYEVEYVLDITGKVPIYLPITGKVNETPKFHHKESEIAEKCAGCPGILIGIYHKSGYNATLKWINSNPNWQNEYY